MLSYKHAFHAGNHADLLKHIILTLTLDLYKQKDKPFVYIDTHAGSGIYSLKDHEANTTNEYKHGINKLKPNDQLLKLAPSYFEVINKLNHNEERKLYPGSPYFASSLLREQDQMIFMELHNVEYEKLHKNFARDPRCHLHHRDGFEGLVALTPPTPRRGLVLIDPSYELVEDYKTTISTIEKAIKRWNVGCFIVWYPLLANSKDHSLYMHESFRKIQAKNSFTVKLCPQSPKDENVRMYGSAISILNAPYKLYEQVKLLLPLLHDQLKQSDQANSKIEIINMEE